MENFEESGDKLSLPLRIFESIPIGSIRSNSGEEFVMRVGLDKDLVAQLKEKSLDADDLEVQKYTSDKKRFGEGSYEDWYAKHRVPFALVDSSGHLAALAWFGPKPLGRKSLRFLSPEELKEEGEQKEDDWHTIVYRSYKPYRGNGLMTPFLRAAIKVYKKQYPQARLWAGISTENPASLALAGKLGFEVDQAHVDTEAHWCAMIEPD